MTLLGDEWLSDEIISTIVEELKMTGEGTLVEDWLFAWTLKDCMGKEGLEEKSGGACFDESGLLQRVAKKIEQHKLERLIFPAHVHGNHWIVCFVDFQQREVGYGDSFATKMQLLTSMVNALHAWLAHLKYSTFINTGNTLPCLTQDDTFNCGMFAMNTLQHQVAGMPLWVHGGNLHGDISLS
ncbi:hypothetical protein P691DRAFT_760258 [Macrolepiota fuliginosa MF-IS2]|uniref:Ubiquitin-like protease family profile domain-containing protein n=1 Tax=Macrolepiota fuliginosa MF-IS2 TaxID=1400762 RepID=A0A9P5XDD8_9AGAR|nr:hypothetical protein P691DRAFT_760258 [Macrolepiota fuliginosa MF-IS2]